MQVCAFYEHPQSHGRVAVLGSAHMLSDQYLEKEENGKIRDVIFQFLTAKDFKLNQIDADDPEVLILPMLILPLTLLALILLQLLLILIVLLLLLLLQMPLLQILLLLKFLC